MFMNYPKLALVGRPNVGKSALFNRICQKRLAIVDAEEGVTRDRAYAMAELFGKKFLVVDTGGIDPLLQGPFSQEVREQSERAIQRGGSRCFGCRRKRRADGSGSKNCRASV